MCKRMSTINGAASIRSRVFKWSAPVGFLGSRLHSELRTSNLLKGLKEKLWTSICKSRIRITDRTGGMKDIICSNKMPVEKITLFIFIRKGDGAQRNLSW